MKYTPLRIFGQGEYSFLEAVQHYNVIKAGYDGPILASARNDKYIVDVSKDGSVRVKNNLLYSEINKELSFPGTAPNIGFEFFTQVKKGFRAKVTAFLSRWSTDEVLANYEAESHELKQGKLGPSDYFQEKENSGYDLLRIELFKHYYEDGSNEQIDTTEKHLQRKIWEIIKQDDLKTNKYFIIRVRQAIWDISKELEEVSDSDIFARDDSLILVVEPDAVPI